MGRSAYEDLCHSIPMLSVLRSINGITCSTEQRSEQGKGGTGSRSTHGSTISLDEVQRGVGKPFENGGRW